ncbi:MAG: RNA polymerase sigma factor RpoH [Gammaproteobacteria bacterium]|nr:RNA polymerase sigma factor RpoH [Gammaproteobacteria bacterium]
MCSSRDDSRFRRPERCPHASFRWPSRRRGRDLDAYIQTVSGFDILSVEEEQALARRFHEEDDLEAARRLVLSHLRFVVHMARSYSGYGLPQADLIQEGNVGLMKAVKRFDPAYGVRLVSFAVHWIKAEMHEFILRNWRIVKVATTKAQRKLFFNLRGQKKRLGWMTGDEVRAIAADLGVEPDRGDPHGGPAGVLTMPPSTAIPATTRTRPRHRRSIWQDTASDPADLVADEDSNSSATESLRSALDGLDERSRDIVASRWLADEKLTLHDLADRYGVSAERIRQIEVRRPEEDEGLHRGLIPGRLPPCRRPRTPRASFVRASRRRARGRSGDWTGGASGVDFRPPWNRWNPTHA